MIGSILDQVQIDHTVIDVVIVDERERQSIGRPCLTVAIDAFSRTIVGLVLTLEPPSAVSVGLCLANTIVDKRPWIERFGRAVDWPMSGKPKSLFLDNAAEFKSEALRRGCEQHGIRTESRKQATNPSHPSTRSPRLSPPPDAPTDLDPEGALGFRHASGSYLISRGSVGLRRSRRTARRNLLL